MTEQTEAEKLKKITAALEEANMKQLELGVKIDKATALSKKAKEKA